MTRRRRKLVGRALLGLVALGILAAALFPVPTRFYPNVAFQMVESVQVNVLLGGRATVEQCMQSVGQLATAMEHNCKSCKVIQQNCLEKLSSRQQRMLSGLAVDTSIMRIPNGVVEFRAGAQESAFLACAESEKQTTRAIGSGASCLPPDTQRFDLTLLESSAGAAPVSFPNPSSLFGTTVLAFLVSFVSCFLIIRYDRLHARFSHDPIIGGPQKSHSTPTARIGGVGIGLGLLVGVLAGENLAWTSAPVSAGLTMLVFAAIPAVGGGLAEDFTKKVGVLARLMLTLASGVLASALIGATLDRVGIPGIDRMLQWPVFAIALTAFAVGGIANATNIIDGHHGLASGYLIIVFSALSYVAFEVGDSLVVSATLVMIGAIMGFLIWNWPFGKIFLGDGGAYLLGFWVAELSVLLVVRNPELSPWFPLALLVYPIFETFFSIYRRSVLRGDSPGRPDALHLHTLIYRRVIKRSGWASPQTGALPRNSFVAPYAWIYGGLVSVVAALVPRHAGALILLTALSCGAYVYLYWRIVSLKAPKWLVKSATQ